MSTITAAAGLSAPTTPATATAPRRKLSGYGQLIAHLKGLLAPSRVAGRLKRFENGSIKAAVELHCLTCCAGDIGSIRDCTSEKTCPLHPHRPYQSDASK